MLKTEKDKRTCEFYSQRDDTGKVHCSECPLALKEVAPWGACKACFHYDRKNRQWVPD